MMHILKAVTDLIDQFQTGYDFFAENADGLEDMEMPPTVGSSRPDAFLIAVLDYRRDQSAFQDLMIGYIMIDGEEIHAVMGSCYLGKFPSTELAAKGVALAYRG